MCPFQRVANVDVLVYFQLWDACRTFKLPPRLGGLDEQLAVEVEALSVCEAALNEYTAWRRAGPVLTPEASLEHIGQMIKIMGGKDLRPKRG